ncbi:MAG: AraC family transcriptional regulator [Acidiferrobacterales bacterium]
MQPTTISSWALLIWKAIESYGRDPRPLFEQAAVDPNKLRDPNARYPISALTRLWNLAARETRDPCLGLTAARFLHPTTLHALGYSWLASDTLKEALERAVRYHRLVSNGFEARLEEIGEHYRFVIKPDDAVRVADEAIDAGMASLMGMCRASCGADFNPLHVSMQRKPPTDRGAYSRVFRAPIEFGAPENVMTFGRETLNVPLPTGNAELARANDKVIREYLARFDRGSIKHQVEVKLLEQLSSGHASQESIAKSLNLSPRTLQRKLKQEATTYKQLLDETRRELATQYVREAHLSVNEITFLLGFSEPANFTRAFKRWNGVSPSQFRAS